MNKMVICRNCGHKIKKYNGRWFHVHRYCIHCSEADSRFDTFGYKYNIQCYEPSKISTGAECNCRRPQPKKKYLNKT